MSDPDITREILRGAIEKHAEAADDEALVRVVSAARGIRTETVRHDAEQAQSDHTELIASTRPAPVIGAKLSDDVLGELARNSPPRIARRYKQDE